MALPNLKTPEFTLELPSSGEKIKYRPFLVKEEKVLLMATEGDDPKAMVSALIQIVENCTFGKVQPRENPLFDLEYIFLNLRAKSVGEIAEPTLIPSDCDKPVQLSVDLNQVEVVKAEGHTNKIPLTDTVGVVMKYPSIDQAENQDPNMNLQDPEVGLQIISDCIDSIYDGDQIFNSRDHSREEMQEFVEGLTQDQFMRLINFFESMPKIRYQTKYTCPCTGEEKEIVLAGLQDFFGSPSATTT